MGHLSMSERSSTTSVETAAASSESNLKHRLVTNGKPAVSASANGFPKKNGQPLVSAVDGEVKNIEQRHHVNLEEYTKNFKGDKVLGIQFEAPLKWGNITMITLLHLFFVYSYITFPLSRLNIYSVIFGKFLTKSIKSTFRDLMNKNLRFGLELFKTN